MFIFLFGTFLSFFCSKNTASEYSARCQSYPPTMYSFSFKTVPTTAANLPLKKINKNKIKIFK